MANTPSRIKPRLQNTAKGTLTYLLGFETFTPLQHSPHRIDMDEHVASDSDNYQPNPKSSQSPHEDPTVDAQQSLSSSDMSKLSVLAEVASRQAYLPVPKDPTPETFTTEERVQGPTPWDHLLRAADEAYRRDFPSNSPQTIAMPLRGAKTVTRGYKQWTAAEDAALITLRSEGLKFREIAGRIEHRGTSAVAQRWYKLKRKFGLRSSDEDDAGIEGNPEESIAGDEI